MMNQSGVEKAEGSHEALSPRFPQEVFDKIIDNLGADKATLRACSLVSRSWDDTASKHLFRRLLWPPCRHVWSTFDEYEERLGACGDGVHFGGFDTCLVWLSNSPRVRRVVQEVILSSLRPRAMDGMAQSAIEPLVSTTLFAIMDLLSCVHTLELHDCLVLYHPSGLTHTTQVLKVLRIQNGYGYAMTSTLETVALLLGHFSDISELIIQGIIPKGAPPSSIALPNISTRVTSLELATSPVPPGGAMPVLDLLFTPIREMMDVLVPRFDMTRLRAFHTTQPCSAVINVLSHACNLADFSCYTGNELNQRSLPLHPDARLRVFRITHPVWPDMITARLPALLAFPTFAKWDRSILSDLNSIATSEMERIHIVLEDHSPGIMFGPLHLSDWPRRPPSPEAFRQQLQAVVAGVDWDAFASFLERCTGLQLFRLEVQSMQPTLSPEAAAEVAEGYQPCAEVIRTAMRPMFERVGWLQGVVQVAVSVNNGST